MWFCFDGLDFQTHATEAKAKAEAEKAMQFWSDDADDGWDDASTHVCYGEVIGYVEVKERTPEEGEKFFLPPDCEIVEEHTLVIRNSSCRRIK